MDVKPLKHKAGHAHQMETGDAVPVVNGGTGLTTVSNGGLLYASALDTLAALSVGTAGQVLCVVSSLPSWQTNIPGVSGGRSITGGTGAGDDLRFVSTTHGTPGKVHLGKADAVNNSQTYYDDLLRRLVVSRHGNNPALILHRNSESGEIPAAGMTCGIDFEHENLGAIGSAAMGKLLVDLQTLTGGAQDGRLRVQLIEDGALGTVWECDENAGHHRWSLGGTERMELTSSGLSVGSTITAGTHLTLTAGNITTSAQTGVSSLKRSSSGAIANILDLVNTGTGAVSSGSALRFLANDAGENSTVAASLSARLDTITDGAEDGLFYISVMGAGSNAVRLAVNSQGRVGIGTGVGAINSVLEVRAGTLGEKIFQRKTTATSDDPVDWERQGRVATTNATTTTLTTETLTANNVYHIRARVRARRTGGSAGTAGDGGTAEIVGSFTHRGGAAVQIGATTTVHSQFDQAWTVAFDVSGNDVRVRVTGAANNNVTWHSLLEVSQVGS